MSDVHFILVDTGRWTLSGLSNFTLSLFWTCPVLVVSDLIVLFCSGILQQDANSYIFGTFWWFGKEGSSPWSRWDEGWTYHSKAALFYSFVFGRLWNMLHLQMLPKCCFLDLRWGSTSLEKRLLVRLKTLKCHLSPGFVFVLKW